jgi:hypothetical protein
MIAGRLDGFQRNRQSADAASLNHVKVKTLAGAAFGGRSKGEDDRVPLN